MKLSYVSQVMHASCVDYKGFCALIEFSEKRVGCFTRLFIFTPTFVQMAGMTSWVKIMLARLTQSQ